MATFIKLTSADEMFGAIYANAEMLVGIVPVDDVTLLIVPGATTATRVRETPEEILSLIAAASTGDPQ